MLSGINTSDAREAATCLRDIVALSTLPAIWTGAEPLRIAESLAASLFTTLNPEFLYVSLAHDPDTSPVEVAQYWSPYDLSDARARSWGCDHRLRSNAGP